MRVQAWCAAAATVLFYFYVRVTVNAFPAERDFSAKTLESWGNESAFTVRTVHERYYMVIDESHLSPE